MDQFYDYDCSLFIEAYDAFYGAEPPEVVVAFYERLAREAVGPTLEIACGTGRIAIALARKGLGVIGVDLSEGLLTVARRKTAALAAPVRNRLTFLNQDMSELNLNRSFGFICIPGRSFQHLLTIDLQRKSLQAIHRHLKPDGRLSLHLFDPRLDLLIDENASSPGLSGTDLLTSRRYVAHILQTRLDHLTQIRRDLWRYRELGSNGEVLAEATREMALRWTYRWELHHLLALSGLWSSWNTATSRAPRPPMGRN